ncbi:MAG: LD-carboxypeptidase [Acidothermales bacterium]|nr:LD-carboxypeptidase [Acidothermales bacterium]
MPRRPLRRPPRLRPGDRVAVVAPSGPVDPDRLHRGCALLTSWELRVTLGRHVNERSGFLAGADAGRAADLVDAWCDPDVRAVLCARGGYGATRLLGLIDWPALAAVAEPPWLVGGSDVTALHEAVATHLGRATLFGPMPAGDVLGGVDGPDPGSAAALHTALFAPPGPLTLTTSGTANATLVPGRARGVTAGGTLALLAAAVGTPDTTSADGAVLLLEDVGERAYRIDRMLTQLLRSGWLDGVTGVALGCWEHCGAGTIDVLAERLGPLGVPVLAGLPFGHGVPQLSVPLGAPALLDTAAGTLTVDPERAVSQEGSGERSATSRRGCTRC